MKTVCLLLALDAASAFGPAVSGSGERLISLRPAITPSAHRRAGKIALKELPKSFEEYMSARNSATAEQDDPNMATRDPSPPAPMGFDNVFSAAKINKEVLQGFQTPSTLRKDGKPSDTDFDNYDRVPWWAQSSTYSEDQRKDRRTIFMHDDWVRHRSSDRFMRNMLSLPSSGINQALSKELAFVTLAAAFVVGFNMFFYQYQDLSGVVHPGPLSFLAGNIKTLSLPALPFSIAMPALSLLLVFRTNTGYSRWNEARTLWGGLINNCRNVVRQSNTFFPNDERHKLLKDRMAAETTAFCMALRNFLRGPTDDATLRGELYGMVEKGTMTADLADRIMGATNRPMYALSAMSATLRKADLDPIQAASIDRTISVLVDLTGANERIFKSPIPIVYTRLTSRFLTIFLLMLPLALWGQLGESWNHWATVPAEAMIAFFLFGIEEVGIQIEEPFSILPLEAFCNGAISACAQEMLAAEQDRAFEQGHM